MSISQDQWSEIFSYVENAVDARLSNIVKRIERIEHWIDPLPKPDLPQECTCDARRREEEAGMIWWLFECGMYGGRKDGVERRWDICIHCNLPIKRSLLTESKP